MIRAIYINKSRFYLKFAMIEKVISYLRKHIYVNACVCEY